MNDRMHELYASACLYAREQQLDLKDKNVPAFVECMAEKFAELIVQECASYMYENYPDTRYKVNYMRKHMGDPNWNIPIGNE